MQLRALVVLAAAGLGGGVIACGAGGADSPSRNNINRQQPISAPLDDNQPASPRDMPGKGRGSETKWDRKINH